MKKLEDVNTLFLANLLGVSKRGCPAASLYIETFSLLIPNRILQSQLLFLHHVATLPHTSLANETYRVMREQGYPGLFVKCRRYLEEWNLTNMEAHSKWSSRRIIKQRIKQKNLNDLVEWSERYKKINTEKVKRRSTEMSPYLKRMNLKESQVIFRKSCSLLQTVRMN